MSDLEGFDRSTADQSGQAGSEPTPLGVDDPLRDDGVEDGEDVGVFEAADGEQDRDDDSPRDDSFSDEGDESTGGRFSAQIGSAERSLVQSAENLFNSKVNVFNDSGGLDWLVRRRALSGEDYDTWSIEELEVRSRSLVVEEAVIAEVVERLRADRFVVITGNQGLGKGAISQAVAARIGAAGEIHRVHRARGLEYGVQLRPERLFGRRNGFRRCVFIVEDFSDEGNRDLEQFTSSLDRPQIEALGQKLKQSKSYLILMAALDRLPVRPEQLTGLGVLMTVAPPSHEALVRALHQLVSLRRDKYDGQEPELLGRIDSILADRATWLGDRLGTIPRAARFVEQLLVPVARGEMTIERALECLDDLEHWFLSELPEDRTLWSFVLALTLATAHPLERWVPWAGLHALWRAVEEALEGELVRGEGDGTPRSVRRLIVDSSFLNDARAEARQFPFPLGQAVRFAEPRTSDSLWRVLLGPGRALLATVVPALRKLSASEHHGLREIAARSLGRLGEIEPRAVTLPQIKALLQSESHRQAFSLGEILVGSLKGQDQSYFQGCLAEVLEAIDRTDDLKISAAGFMSLVPLGAVEPLHVLELLHELLGRRLSDPDDRRPPLSRRIHEVMERLGGDEWTAEQLSPGELEVLAFSTLGKPALVALQGTQFVLVGLCFRCDPIPVLERVTAWMEEDPSTIAPWIALLALRKQGLLRLLEQHSQQSPRSREGEDNRDRWRPESFNRILLAADDDDSIRSVARFLERAYASCEPLPARLRQHLQQRLIGQLRAWIESAAPVPWLRPRVVSLLTFFLGSDEEALRHEVFELLRRDPKMTEEDSPANDLAMEALRSSMPGM